MNDFNLIVIAGNVLGIFFYKGIETKTENITKYFVSLPFLISYHCTLNVCLCTFCNIKYESYVAKQNDFFVLILIVVFNYVKLIFYFILREKYNVILAKISRIHRSVKTTKKFTLRLFLNILMFISLVVMDFKVLKSITSDFVLYVSFMLWNFFIEMEQFVIYSLLNIIFYKIDYLNKMLTVAFNAMKLNGSKKKSCKKFINYHERDMRIILKHHYETATLSLETNKLFGLQQLLTLIPTICSIVTYVYFFIFKVRIGISELNMQISCVIWIGYNFVAFFYMLNGWCNLLDVVSN